MGRRFPVKRTGLVIMESLAIIQSNASAYPRNQALLKTLKENSDGIEIDEKYSTDKNFFALISYFLFHSFKSRQVLFLWPASHMLLPILILKLRGKTIFLDVFTSMYDSLVSDRKTIGPYSIKAFYYYCCEYLTLRLADVLFFDTDSQQTYLMDLFRIKHKKSTVLPVSIDFEWVKSIPTPAKGTHFSPDKFNVFFYGTFIPLQGIEYIIRAASLTRDINVHFWILGRGQKYEDMLKLAKQTKVFDRLTFLPSVGYADLIGYIKESDLCLGIFGDTQKAQRVIPNKLLECAACAKPIITGSNPEINHFFKDDESALFCPMGDSEALAQRIRWAIGQPEVLAKLGSAAQKVVADNFSLESLGLKIKQLFSDHACKN